MEHQPGDIIQGRYKIISVIGRGAFGETYLAEDTQSPGLVCLLKYLKPHMNSPRVLEIAEKYFRQEAYTMRLLANYNQQIPQLYNYFEENQKFYLVQEYIEGQNLEEELRTQLFSETQVIEVLQDILRVLDFIHQNNVIHRDIKPANLIRRKCDNKIFLIDFGAVKQVSTITVNAQGQTISTLAIGTPYFIPPEQLAGKPIFASDIYALGVAGFVLLTGRIPQKNQNDEIIWNGVQVHPQLATILDKMVRSDYKKRYERAADILFDLEPLTLVNHTLNQRYYIKSYLGGGEFNSTYLAEDGQRPYQPRCVIKQFKLRVNNQKIWQEAQTHFLNAVTSVERMPHHHQIPRFLNHFQNNQEFYLVYEFIEGEALNKQITVGKHLSESEVITLLKDVLEVLVFIHQHGVIHGDIKPSNLIQQQEHKIILIDFVAFKQSVNLDIDRQIIVIKPGGTNGYMPPEQLQNKLKTCSDIYALGMTAIQALTAVSPEQLPTNSHNEVIWENQAQVSRKLARILNKMTRFQSGQRYQSAQEVLNELNDLNGWIWQKFVKLSPLFVILGVFSIGLIYFFCTRLQEKNQVEPLYAQGLELIRKGDYAEAIKTLDEVLKINPNIPEVLIHQGYAYGQLSSQLKREPEKQELGKYYHVCKRATEIAPNVSGSWLCLGNSEQALKKYEDSIISFDKTIGLACNSHDVYALGDCAYAWNNKGESFLRLKNPNPGEALKAFEQAIQKNPKLHVAWTNKGEVLLNTSPQEALKAFDEALKIEPDYKLALEGKRKALRSLGN